MARKRPDDTVDPSTPPTSPGTVDLHPPAAAEPGNATEGTP